MTIQNLQQKIEINKLKIKEENIGKNNKEISKKYLKL